jgi:4-aminobutyrate aminotransferase/(S)-3-amino-2-methylpropionate transaminase
MLAMEFVKPGTKIPDVDAAKQVANHANNNGVLTLTAGTYGNVIRLLPPLVIGEELLSEALDVLEAGVGTLA